MKKGILFAAAMITIGMVFCANFLLLVEKPAWAWQSDLRREFLKLAGGERLSCANPSEENIGACLAIERQIMDSTVRVELQGWVERADVKGEVSRVSGSVTSHGTVVGGRFVITHNHNDLPINPLRARHDRKLTAISLHRVDGTTIIEQASPSIYRVYSDSGETVILDFGTRGSQGFFDSLGVPSAKQISWRQSEIRPGMEIAQIDWDGENTYVVWAMVENIEYQGGVPRIELTSFVEVGASGGGVFLNGYHIGNNWRHITSINQHSGEIVRAYTVAALNPDLSA